MNELNVQTHSRIEDMTSNPLHRRILQTAAEEYNIDPHVIEFGHMMSMQADDDGNWYIEDLNGVVRYYPEFKLTIPTEDYEELVQVSTHDSYTGINPTSILQMRGKYRSA